MHVAGDHAAAIELGSLGGLLGGELPDLADRLQQGEGVLRSPRLRVGQGCADSNQKVEP